MQFFYRRSLYRLVAAASCSVGVISPSWSQEHFKPDVVRKYAGAYASNCSNPNAPRLRILRDALVVEQGDKRVVGRKVQAALAYPDRSPPPDFKLALLGEVRTGSALRFIVFEDKTGTSIRLQADMSLQIALGKTLLTTKYRRCGDAPATTAAANSTQNEPMSDAEKILLNPGFKSTYLRVLGPLAREAWLAKLSGPRPPARRVRVAGMDYLLLAVCKPHDCANFNAALLYAEDRDRLFGKVYQQGRTSFLGETPPEIAHALDTYWSNQWQAK